MNEMSEHQVAMPASEIVSLGAEDPNFYSKTFFPRTVRQDSAPFHEDIWNALEDPSHRMVNIQVFRGGAKTTLLRLFTSRRIAYNISRTILYIGKSEGHAARSVRWLRRNIMYNRMWADTFGLSRGEKWTDTEAEIQHGIDETPIWIMAMGITGSIRGINQDDFRPDLIILDDVLDEENTATPEQREKIKKLVYGAVKESLSPSSESPAATIAMLNTPHHREDVSVEALSDEEWTSFVYSCFTEAGESRWPKRWTTEELNFQKDAAFKRNQGHVWLREKECKLVDPASAAFISTWWKTFDLAPTYGVTVMAIDPVPPPSEREIQQGLKYKDYEAISVVRKHAGRYYVLEVSRNRGHEPDWTIMEFFRLALKYRPRSIVVEGVAYQKTLAWLIKKAMKARRQYFVVEEVTDRRKKYDRIVDSIAPAASLGMLEFAPNLPSSVHEQFCDYPNVSHDDDLDSIAMAITKLSGMVYVEGGEADVSEEEIQAELEKDAFGSGTAQIGWRGAP